MSLGRLFVYGLRRRLGLAREEAVFPGLLFICGLALFVGMLALVDRLVGRVGVAREETHGVQIEVEISFGLVDRGRLVDGVNNGRGCRRQKACPYLNDLPLRLPSFSDLGKLDFASMTVMNDMT
jgi:hypothetical protein